VAGRVVVDVTVPVAVFEKAVIVVEVAARCDAVEVLTIVWKTVSVVGVAETRKLVACLLPWRAEYDRVMAPVGYAEL